MYVVVFSSCNNNKTLSVHVEFDKVSCLVCN